MNELIIAALFLGSVCLAVIYAAIVEMRRESRRMKRIREWNDLDLREPLPHREADRMYK